MSYFFLEQIVGLLIAFLYTQMNIVNNVTHTHCIDKHKHSLGSSLSVQLKVRGTSAPSKSTISK